MALTLEYLATEWRQEVAHGVSRGTCLYPNRQPRMGRQRGLLWPDALAEGVQVIQQLSTA